jgi:hypothetical protein
MADFEELKLTVSLVDDISPGLTAIRTQLTQLTQTAGQVQTALSGVAASTEAAGKASRNAHPEHSAHAKALKELGRSAEETGRGILQMGLAARRGAEAFPELALATREAWTGMQGVSVAMGALGVASRGMVVALGGVALGIAAVGAAVAAYGISVFKFSQEMFTLSQTAKALGMTLGTLRNLTEQNERFGISTEKTIAQIGMVNEALTDLTLSGSKLRQSLLGQGLPAQWIDDYLKLDNEVDRYNKRLEEQIKIRDDWIKKGVQPEVAATIAGRFQTQLGGDPGSIARGPMRQQTAEEKARMEAIAAQSAIIAEQWRETLKLVSEIKTAFLSWGLPGVVSAVESINVGLKATLSHLDSIGKWLGIYGSAFRGLLTGGPIGAISGAIRGAYAFKEGNTSAPGKAAGEPIEHRLGGGPVRSGQPYIIGEGGPEIMVPDSSGVVVPFGRVGGGRGGSGSSASLTQEELVDETSKSAAETAKLTTQLEKLNAYFERTTGGPGGPGKGGGMPATGANAAGLASRGQIDIPRSATTSSDVSTMKPGAEQQSYAGGSDKQKAAQAVANELRAQGIPENAIAGMLANANSESSLNPALRHADQPRFSGEAHYAHGVFQEGGAEWNTWAADMKSRGLDPNTAWKDPKEQARFVAGRLKGTIGNQQYAGLYSRMTAPGVTREQAAQMFVSGYLKPAEQYRRQREAQYGQGVPDVEHYTGKGTVAGGAGYQSDLDYLTQHGGHDTIGGKSVPAGTPGSYKQENPEFVARLRAAGEAYKRETGQAPVYGELSRDEATQATYYDRYRRGLGGIAARPGRSRHQGGEAGDLPDSGFRRWLKSGHSGEFGLHFPVRGDAPHVQADPSYQGHAFADLDRPALDRTALNRPTEVNHKGRLDVSVSAPPGTKANYNGTGLLKNTSMERQTQMVPTQTGPTVGNIMDSYMRGGN